MNIPKIHNTYMFAVEIDSFEITSGNSHLTTSINSIDTMKILKIQPITKHSL